MQNAPPTPKGFRDINPSLAKKRRQSVNKIIETLETFGFEPLETPIVEFAQTLKGKYGEEEKLIYEFEDRGGRKLALRYDLTVPLARYVASNPSLKMPFRRYQLGQVFRGENPQAGRYREFTQFDFDSVGENGLEEDALIIASALNSVKKIGLNSAFLLINDRKNFADIPKDVVVAIDKLHKIGQSGVIKELLNKGLAHDDINNHLYKIKNQKANDEINNLFKLLTEKYHLKEDIDYKFDPTLARGLNYYTGSIFELKPNSDPTSLTIGSGGRYDNLIGMFAKISIPAVGFSFGIDRLTETVPR